MLSTGSKITAAVIVFLLAVFGGTAAADTVVFSDNFQAAPTGPLGAPWSIAAGTGVSTAVVADTPDHGRVLNLRGSAASGDFLSAIVVFSAPATEIQYSYAVNPSAGSAFVTTFRGTGGYSSRRISLQQGPNSTLTSQSSSGSVSCGSLTPGVWSTVTLRVHATAAVHTFDVLINDAPTSCTGIITRQVSPFRSITLMDSSTEGWGGSVLFDDFLATTP